MVGSETSIFGSPLRDRILVLLEVKGSSHLREIARIYGVSVSVVRWALVALERDGLVIGRAVGRSRLLELNPRFFCIQELRALLGAVAAARPELFEPAMAVRSRPRRSGKPL